MGSTHPLELKAYQDLEWFDFPFIERPDMAVLTLPKAFHNPMSPHIRGLSAFNREGFSVFDAAPTGELTGVIKALERGTHFLLNQGTHFPAVIRLEISKDQTPVWELSPYISGSARALLSHQIYNADVPKVSAPIRQEADATETQSKPQQKQKPQIERHMIQLEVEGENGRPLPERKNVTIVVHNTSQDTIPVEQRRNVIYDPETRIFKTKPGEAFKVYAINERMVDVQKDLNDNHNLSQSEANGLIRPLEITGSDKRHDDVIIHYAKYVVPNNYIEIELLDEDDDPEIGVKYQVLDLNGNIFSEGTLNSEGYAFIEGIEENDSQVVFPELDLEEIRPEQR